MNRIIYKMYENNSKGDNFQVIDFLLLYNKMNYPGELEYAF
jgi:hypothetical protein